MIFTRTDHDTPFLMIRYSLCTPLGHSLPGPRLGSLGCGLELHHDLLLLRNLLGPFDVAIEGSYFVHDVLQSANDANQSQASAPIRIGTGLGFATGSHIVIGLPLRYTIYDFLLHDDGIAISQIPIANALPTPLSLVANPVIWDVCLQNIFQLPYTPPPFLGTLHKKNVCRIRQCMPSWSVRSLSEAI
jgi:hypothetical protein